MQLKLAQTRKYNRARRASAASIAELGAALIVVIPIVLILIDTAMLAIGVSINDSCCRDAARAAAAGPPAEATTGERNAGPGSEPYKRALDVVKNVWVTNLPMKVKDELKVREKIQDYPLAELGGAMDGEVGVETTIEVNPPCLVGAIVGHSISFKSFHSVNYTYVVPKQPET